MSRLKHPHCTGYITSRNNRVNYMVGRKCRKKCIYPRRYVLSGASVDDRRLSNIHPRIQRLFRREFYS